MIAAVIISIITFILIATSIIFFPKIKIKSVSISTYWVIALLGATLLLVFSLAPIKEVFSQLTSDAAINPIKILVLFFSMTLISVFLDEFGLFKFLAVFASKKAKGKQFVLFLILYGLTALLTVFTSNDVVILTLTPFICFFCKRAKINPLPYLVAEFTAANTWSLLFIIGNPTNIYLASSAGINFIEYFKVMAIPTIVSGIVDLAILILLFHKKLKEPLSASAEDYQVENKVTLIVGVIHLLVCLVFLVISSYIDLEMWLIAMICSLSLFMSTIIISLVQKKGGKVILISLKRLPYPLIPFFLSMFVIVVALNYQGITSEIANFFGDKGTIWVYGYTSFLASNVINNIPMSILYTNLSSSLSGYAYTSAIYASIIGSNIGAFLTPIGALAGIMFTNLLNKHDVKYTFLDFVKYGVIIAIPTITSALVMLYIVL